MTSTSLHEAFEKLVLDAYSVDELRRMATYIDKDFAQNLVGNEATDAKLAASFVDGALRRGLVDQLLTRMEKEREHNEAVVVFRRRWEREGHRPSSMSSIARHNLPRHNPEFVGRGNELDQIHELLSPGTANEVACKPHYALTGLGGVGKTHIALEYAYRHLNKYETVCWVNAEGPDVTSEVARLSRIFVLDVPEGASSEEVATEVFSALQRRGPHLVIFDNVDTPQAIEPWLPGTGDARVLITTRRTTIPGATIRAVPVLPEDAALKLLAAEPEDQGAIELCRELGHLALAVAVARGVLQEGAFTSSSLLEKIRATGPVETFEVVGEPVFQKHPSLIRLFDASVRQLDSKKPADAWAVALLWVSGWFAPVGIPKPLLESAAVCLTGNEPGVQTPFAIHRLVRLSLARGDDKEVTFHRLVQAYARYRGGPQAREAALDSLAIAVNSADDMHDLLKLAPIRPHLHAAVGVIEAGDPDTHIYIAKCLMMHLLYAAEFELSKKVAEQMLRKLNDEHAADFLHFIGVNLSGQEKHKEAREYHLKELDIKERLYGTLHEEVAETLAAIGDTFEGQERFDQAREFFLKALRIQVHKLGPKAPDVASTLRSIGLTLQSEGDRVAAKKFFCDALSVQQQRNPETRTADDEKEIAQTLGLLGRREDAQGCLRRALDIQEKTLGPLHPDLAETRRDLGDELVMDKRYPEALDLYLRARSIQVEELGDSHPEVGITQERLGEIYEGNGQYDLALACYEDALRIFTEVFGTDYPDNAELLISIALTLSAKGDPREAVRYLLRALRLQERVYGTEHNQLMGTLEELEEHFGLLGNMAMSRLYGNRAQQIRSQSA